MAQFDVYRDRAGSGYLLDCQADVLSELNTRFCVPLMRPDEAPAPGKRLNPFFTLAGGEKVVMVTQFAAALPLREVGQKIHSLADQSLDITNALDMLITGY